MRRLALAALAMLLLAPAVPGQAVSSTAPDLLVEVAPGTESELPAGSVHIVDGWYRVPSGVAIADTPGVLRVTADRPAPPPRHLPTRAQPTSTTLSFTPTDPGYGSQWNFPIVGAPAAWDATTGDGVTVAVIDTGVSPGPDLACGSFVDEFDALTSMSGPGTADDWLGHGTHVTGTIAQCTDNGTGVAGLAYNATIMPIKALGPAGGPASAVADAIVWAVDHGADVINLSLGWSCSGTWAEQPDCVQPVVSAAIEHAVNRDVVLVAAAGNDASCTPTVGWVAFPANHPDVIGVAATDAVDGIAHYSNCGLDLSMVAPGGDVAADENSDGNPDGILQETFDSGGYGLFWMDGTSSAAPHVAAAAAMLRATAPHVPAIGIRKALEAAAVDLGETGFDPVYGAGRLDIAASLQSPYLRVARLSGSDRYATAVAVSEAVLPDGPTVYLATGEGFADALAAGAVAGAASAPILLVRHDWPVPWQTHTELNRRAPAEIVLLGGPGAVSDEVRTWLESFIAPVRRLGGADRYDTARLIAEDAYPTGVTPVVVANGETFPDGLVAGAFAAGLGAPVLLTRAGALPDPTREALTAMNPDTVYVIGGDAAVAPAVVADIEAETGAAVVRLAGSDRYATAVAISSASHPTGADTVYLATGVDFPDALSGGPAAATEGAPLLLVRPDDVPAVVQAELLRLAPRRIVVLGGTAAVADTVLLDLATYVTP